MPSDARDRGDWISTYSGRPFWPLDPQPDEVRIADIAHALSQLCRFAGHTREFYSVAQHCLIVSEICGSGRPGLWGLLHDGSEAYLNDITRPVKHASALDGYRVAEARVQAAIYQRFDLAGAEPAIVKHVDALVLRAEQRDLMNMPAAWYPKGEADPTPIKPVPPAVAKREFLRRFKQLCGEVGLAV